MKSDFYEDNNLLDSDREDVFSTIKKFESVLRKYPSMDASTRYIKSKNSFYDIDSINLLKISNRGKSKFNKTRVPIKNNN